MNVYHDGWSQSQGVDSANAMQEITIQAVLLHYVMFGGHEIDIFADMSSALPTLHAVLPCCLR